MIDYMKLKDIFNKNGTVKKCYREKVITDSKNSIDASLLPEPIEDFNKVSDSYFTQYRTFLSELGPIDIGILQFTFKENENRYYIINYESHPEILYYELKTNHFKRLLTIYNKLSDEEKLKLELDD